jgi:hypothetical protein
MNRRSIYIVLGVIFALASLGVTYVLTLPIYPLESLVKVSGTVENVTDYEHGFRTSYVHELRISLEEYQSTIFWSRISIQSLYNALRPGDSVDLWVNRDFVKGMERGEIRQISANGAVLSRYEDWRAWKDSDNKAGWFFVPTLMIIACLLLYAAWKRND